MEPLGDGRSEVVIFLEELNCTDGAEGGAARGFQSGAPNDRYVAFLRRRVHAIRQEKIATQRKLETLEETRRDLQRSEEMYQTLWQEHDWVTKSYRALEQEHARLGEAWRVLDREHARLKEAHQELQELHRRLFDAHLALEADCWRAHAANTELTRNLHDIRSSHAWRLTQCVRRLTGAVRRLAGRLKFWR
jgi:chromosome segregation ATPase